MSKLKERNVENAFRGINMCKSHGGGKNERGLLQNYVISKLSRKDLEDKFCTAIEKNIFLKRQINIKDEKLKLLGTKILRLTQQQKKEICLLDHYHPLDKVIEEQSFRIEQLQNTNKNLIDKVNVLKRQICAQKHLLAPSKGYRPKRINGNIESQKINGKLKFESDSPSGRQDEIEEYDEFNYDEKHPSEDSNAININDGNDTSNKLDRKLQMDNLADSNTDTLKDNLTDAKNLDQQMEPSRPHQTKSFIKCLKPTNSTKEIEIQTSFDKSVKIPNAYEDLSQQLAQERMLVLDLQQQLKSAKLTQRVVDEVEELLKTLNSKNLLKVKETNSILNENKSTQSNDLENSFSLRQELQREKVDLQAQKTMNITLLSKLSDMQKEIDSLRLKSERLPAPPVTEVVPTTSYRKVPPMIKYDSALNSNHSGVKISEQFDQENSKSGLSQNLKNIQSVSQTVTFPISPKSSPERQKSDVEDIKKAEMSPESLSHVQCSIPQITYRVTAAEFKTDFKNDDQISLNVLTNVNPQEIKGDEEDLKSIDGATYNISRNSANTTDDSVSSSHSQADASNDYLSDGEIPKEHSPESIIKDASESPLKIKLSDKKSESVPIEVMAESILKAISQEIDLCTKKLLCAQDENDCHCDDLSNYQTKLSKEKDLFAEKLCCIQDENECHCHEPSNISEEIDVCINKSFCAQNEKECCCDDPTNYQKKKMNEEISVCIDKPLCSQEENVCRCDDPNNDKNKVSEEADTCTNKLLCSQEDNECRCNDPNNYPKNISEENDLCINKLLCAKDEIYCRCDGVEINNKNTSGEIDVHTINKLSSAQDKNECHCDEIKSIKSNSRQKSGEKTNGSSQLLTKSKSILKGKSLSSDNKLSNSKDNNGCHCDDLNNDQTKTSQEKDACTNKLCCAQDENECHCDDSSTCRIKVSKSGSSRKSGQKLRSSLEVLKKFSSKTVSKDKSLLSNKKLSGSKKSSDKEQRQS